MVVEQTNFGPNGYSYTDVMTGKTVKGKLGNYKSKNQIETEEMDDFFSNIIADDSFIWGKRNFPTPAEIAIESINPAYKKEVDEEIKENNRMVERRAKILTYSQNELGMKFAPRVQIGGMGGGVGKVAKIAAPAYTKAEFPPWFIMVPDGMKLSHVVDHMTPRELAEYVDNGSYQRDLAQGQLSENEPYLERLLFKKINYEKKSSSSPKSEVPEETSSSGSSSSSEVPKETSNNKQKMSKATKLEKWRKITNGLGLSKDQKKEFYKKKEIKKWLDDVDISSKEKLESVREKFKIGEFGFEGDEGKHDEGDVSYKGDEGEPDDAEFEPNSNTKAQTVEEIDAQYKKDSENLLAKSGDLSKEQIEGKQKTLKQSYKRKKRMAIRMQKKVDDFVELFDTFTNANDYKGREHKIPKPFTLVVE